MFYIQTYTFLETTEQVEEYISQTAKDIEATDDADPENKDYEENRKARIQDWKQKSKEVTSLMLEHLPLYVVNVKEIVNTVKSARNYIKVNDYNYYTVIGLGAFGQVFLAGSSEQKDLYDQC